MHVLTAKGFQRGSVRNSGSDSPLRPGCVCCRRSTGVSASTEQGEGGRAAATSECASGSAAWPAVSHRRRGFLHSEESALQCKPSWSPGRQAPGYMAAHCFSVSEVRWCWLARAASILSFLPQPPRETDGCTHLTASSGRTSSGARLLPALFTGFTSPSPGCRASGGCWNSKHGSGFLLAAQLRMRGLGQAQAAPRAEGQHGEYRPDLRGWRQRGAQETSGSVHRVGGPVDRKAPPATPDADSGSGWCCGVPSTGGAVDFVPAAPALGAVGTQSSEHGMGAGGGAG